MGGFLKFLKEGQNSYGYTTVDSSRTEPPHRHQFRIDRQGNGITSENGDGVHNHMVIGGLLQYANGHNHGLGALVPDLSEFRFGDEFGNGLGVNR